MGSVAWPNFINGFAGGFVFVPLTTMAMGRLRKQEIGNAAGIYNLMRNIGGSIGIASVTTMLVRGAQTHQNYLAANISAGNPTADGSDAGLAGKVQHWRGERVQRASTGYGHNLSQRSAAGVSAVLCR